MVDIPESTPENQPFHNYQYSWNFGDTNSGAWGTSKKSQNTAKGPIAAHLYETPGVYTATFNVRGSDGIIGTSTTTITVQNPNVVFSGTHTTCVNSSGDTNFSGCPAGANQVQTNDLTSINTYADAGERILLKRSASWTVTRDINWPNNAGPVHIGAYGQCSSPDDLGVCSNAPRVTVSGGKRFIDFSNKQNWRLSDISFSAPAVADGIVCINGTTGMKHNLILRINTTGFYSPFLWTHYRRNNTDYIDDNAVISSRFANMHQWALYGGSERFVIMGNVLKNSEVSHVLRAWQIYRGVVSHNIISGSGEDDNNNGNASLKLHGPEPQSSSGKIRVGTFEETGERGLRNYSKLIVVSNNVFGSSGPWSVCIGPKDNSSMDRISDVLFEKNKIIAGYGEQNVQLVQRGLSLWGRYLTARNNILDGTGGYPGFTGITAERRGIEWTPLAIKIYNNTIYSQTNHSNAARGIRIMADASGTEIKNNYVSFPYTTGSITLIEDQTGGHIVTSNNVLSNTPHFVAPNISSLLERDFNLTALAILAIGKGIRVPVIDDIDDKVRNTPFDLGAHIFKLSR